MGAIREGIQHRSRDNTPKLYCSGDLLGSLRHAQLRIAGAPMKAESLISLIRLKTGNLWHDTVSKIIIDQGWPVMTEVRLSDWLPEGWGARADWLFWDVEKRAFRIGDLKTTKGEGLRFISTGPKDDHRWQLSAYYHALVAARFPMIRELVVLYLPMNDVAGEEIEPVFVDFDPVPRDEIWALMEQRWALTQEYRRASSKSFAAGDYINENLAPPMERVQKLFWMKDHWDVKLMPHWSTMFCPFENDLCDCSEQGQTKIGEWRENGYNARKGYESIEPVVAPKSFSLTLPQAA